MTKKKLTKFEPHRPGLGAHFGVVVADPDGQIRLELTSRKFDRGCLKVILPCHCANEEQMIEY